MLTILKMLEMGKDFCLDSASAAYSDVSRHYDLHFSSKDDWKEVREFDALILGSPLVEKSADGKSQFKDLSIDEAITLIKAV